MRIKIGNFFEAEGTGRFEAVCLLFTVALVVALILILKVWPIRA